MTINKYHILTTLALIFYNITLNAQAEATVDVEHVNNVLSNLLLYAGLAIIIFTVLAVLKVNSILTESIKIKLLQEHGVDVFEKAGLEIKESWWKRQYKRWTNAVPVEKEADVMLDHNYDGIRELDNSLPPWWVAMFYISIAFGFVYIFYTHFSDFGKSSHEQYAIEVEKAEASIKAYLASQANAIDESNVEMLESKDEIAIGGSIFKTSCSTCHGLLGEGGIGPNLTDEYWLHGGSIKDIFKTIKYGVPEKGMIAWQTQMRPADIHKISSYIMTLKGTNPPNPKEPQGEIYKAEEEENNDTATEDKALGMK